MSEWEVTSLELAFYKFKGYETSAEEYTHMAAGSPHFWQIKQQTWFQAHSSSKQKST